MQPVSLDGSDGHIGIFPQSFLSFKHIQFGIED